MAKDDKLLIQISIFLDILLTILAFLLAYLIKMYLLPGAYRGVLVTANFYVAVLLVIIIWYLSIQYFNLSRLYFRKTPFSVIFRNVAKVITSSMLVLSLFFYMLKLDEVSRIMIGVFYVADIILLSVSRALTYRLLRYFKRKKSLLVNVLVVIGSKQAAKDLVTSIQGDEECNFKILGCLDIDEDAVGKELVTGVNVIGTLNQLRDVLTNYVVDEVIFAMPVDLIWDAEKYFTIVEDLGVQIRVVPHWHLRKFLASRPVFYSIDFEDFMKTPTFVLSATPTNRGELLIKTIFDFVFSLLALVLLLPLFLVIGCLIKISSPGPVFFKQVRSGLHGRRFTLYKFRTMVPGAEAMLSGLLRFNEANGPVFKIKDDPRIISGIGTFLRKTSLDELPNLFNVLRGEMSLIGPRPPIPDEVAKYQLWERRRLSMKPGVTCIWQIQPRRNELSFSRWMALDLQYIDNWSLWLDCRIFCKTLLAVVFGRGW